MKNGKDIIKSHKTKVTNTSSRFLHMISVNVKAMIVSLLAAFFFIFVGVLISFSTKDPIKYSATIAYIAIFLSFFICGYISSKLHRQKAIIGGLYSFATYIFVIFIISLIIKFSVTTICSTENRIIISLLAFPCSILGSFFGNVRIAKRKSTSSFRGKR